MSDPSPATYEALVDALAAHVAATNPDAPLLTDWALTAASVGGDMHSTSYTHASSKGAYHAIYGLRRHGIDYLVENRDDLDPEEHQ